MKILDFIFGLLILLPLISCAQQFYRTPSEPSARLFPEVFLASRADWFRPDLAVHQVQTVTRSFAVCSDWQPLGDARRLDEQQYGFVIKGDSVREVLTYDAVGRLLRYSFTLLPVVKQRQHLQLLNDFRYRANVLTSIHVGGSPILTATNESLSLDAYLTLRPYNASVGGNGTVRHWVVGNPLRQLQTLSLREVSFTNDKNEHLDFPIATIDLVANDSTWSDTVRLDPQRGFRMVGITAKDIRADSSWLRQPARWLDEKVAASPASDVRVHHLIDYEPSSGYIVQKDYDGLTSFFDNAGRLRLSRIPSRGELFQCGYGMHNELLEVITYQITIPYQKYPHTSSRLPYFGNQHGEEYLIVDCAGKQSQWLPLANGQRAVLSRELVQQVQYITFANGLVKRATVHTISPHYVPDVYFEYESIMTHRGHDGPAVLVKNWRQIKRRTRRTSKYLKAGCVPMKTADRSAHVINFIYTFSN